MIFWFLNPLTLRAIMAAREACTDPGPAMAWEQQAAALEAKLASTPSSSGAQLPRGMSIAGSTAEIRIEGILTKRPDFFAMWFGGGNTTYSNIKQAVAVAGSNPQIRNVVFSIDSPGGSADGLIETMDAISALRTFKKVSVRAENAQSAAYGLAAAAGNIEAAGRGATFGSIGTAISYYLDKDVVTLTNTDSPDKRPDLSTPEGKAVVVKYLDQVNAEFVRSIAQGRGVDVKEVSENYGRGASMTAAEAKRLGLIDKIATNAPRAVPTKGPKAMPAEETEDNRAALNAAVARGVEQERDRVSAHLTMGEGCGDMSIALEAIRGGHAMTQAYSARYLSAGMNRSDRSKRQTESNTAEATLAGVDAATPANAADLGDQVVTSLKSNGGFVRG